MNNSKRFSKAKAAFAVMFMVLAYASAMVLTAQTEAFAASTTDDNASTKVTIQAVDDENSINGEDQFLWEAPALIPFVAKADGDLICPDASVVQIKNLGSYPIQMLQVSFTPTNPWNIVRDAPAAAATSSDVLQFNMKSNSTSVAASDALAGVDVSDKKDFYMAAKDNAGANLSIATEGKMLRSTQDLVNAKECGSITWTVDVA